MTIDAVLTGNLDADAVVDGVKGKIRFTSILEGAGDPTDPPDVIEKGWLYADTETGATWSWSPTLESWWQIGSGFGQSSLAKPTLALTYLFHGPIDRDASDIAPPIPGQPVGMYRQAVSGQNGVYLSDGTGGVDIGSRVPLLDAANLGASVVAAANFYDLDDLPPIAGIENIGPFLDLNGENDFATIWNTQRFLIATQNGVDILLNADEPAAFPLLGRILQMTSMNDYRVTGPDSIELGVKGCVVTCDTTDGDVDITLGPHGGLPRIVLIENRPDPGEAGNDVNIENLAGESAFTTVLPPFCRVMILPDQALWRRWDLLPIYQAGDANKHLAFNGDGTGVIAVAP
jgi:hypothetical protein